MEGIIETNISPFARLLCTNFYYLQFQIVGLSNLFIFGLLVVLLLLAQFAAAKTVDEIIERHLLACGGLEKLSAVQSIYCEGVKEEGAMEPCIKIIKQLNKFCRTEIITGEENAFLLVTNQGAWSFSSQRPGVIEEIPIEQAVALQLQIYPIGPLVDYLANGHIVSLMEKEFLEEKKCFKIKLKTKTGVEMLFWISAKTYLIKKSSIRKQGEGASETQTLYKNYKEIDGLKFAQNIITYVSNRNQPKSADEIFFRKILINPTIDPKMYQPF